MRKKSVLQTPLTKHTRSFIWHVRIGEQDVETTPKAGILPMYQRQVVSAWPSKFRSFSFSTRHWLFERNAVVNASHLPFFPSSRASSQMLKTSFGVAMWASLAAPHLSCCNYNSNSEALVSRLVTRIPVHLDLQPTACALQEKT